MSDKAERFCDELARLREEATPGVWRHYRPVDGHCPSNFIGRKMGESNGDFYIARPYEGETCEANAAHIVALHNSSEAMERVVRAAEALRSSIDHPMPHPVLAACDDLDAALAALHEGDGAAEDRQLTPPNLSRQPKPVPNWNRGWA